MKGTDVQDTRNTYIYIACFLSILYLFLGIVSGVYGAQMRGWPRSLRRLHDVRQQGEQLPLQ